jgi:23S rRNA pseudouridine2605 synthase
MKKDKPSNPSKKKANPPSEEEKRLLPKEVEGMRLNKFIAKSGICSRRQAAELVKSGKVKVNGKVVVEPFYQVQLTDVITHDGKDLSPEMKQVYYLMNKPKNTITTLSDERGRRTVMDIIGHRVKERIFPVGRLDRATTGLLLFTNDGDLAKKLSHPSHEVKKAYHVVLDKEVTKEDLEKIRAGLTLEDGPAPVDEVDYSNPKSTNEIGIVIHIGRNRIVRRIFEHLGYQVVKLDRTYYAGLTKKDLPRGRFRPLTHREIIMLKHFV